MENATVVVSGGKINSVSPGMAPPAGAHVIDAKGKPLTPGLVHPATHLGLLEISTATDTVESSTKASSLGADFDVQYGIDSSSMLVQLARADGLTRAITYPVRSGVAPFAGSGALLRLSERTDLVETAGIGVFATIGNHRGDEGSRTAQWELLRHALDAAKNATDADVLKPVLAGKVPLAISTNRASDLHQASKLAKDYSIRIVIIGGTDAWRVADELAAARIPVILDPEANLPENFDELGARLDNAALLRKAGVTVAIAVLSGIHQSYNAGESLREGAGLAVANGLPYAEALRSITVVPAEIWGVAERCGTIAPGKDGDLVLWDGDPLEPSSAPLAVWVDGKSISLATHQTVLRDRYLLKAGLPAAPHRP
jgi:imidazolonepropionase-like amidohydrolase